MTEQEVDTLISIATQLKVYFPDLRVPPYVRGGTHCHTY